MARGTHRITRRGPVTAAAVVLLVAAGGAAAWFLFLREGAPVDIGDLVRATPEFRFELVSVQGASVEGKVDPSELEGPAAEVRDTLDAVYTAGFVDPGMWEGGEFPELLERFGDQAVRAARRDIEDLSVGADADQIEFVEPFNGRLVVWFLVQDGEPVAAVTRALFGANAEAKDGGHVGVLHDGTFYLRPADDGWEIVGYKARGDVARIPEPLPTDRGAPVPGPTETAG